MYRVVSGISERVKSGRLRSRGEGNRYMDRNVLTREPGKRCYPAHRYMMAMVAAMTAIMLLLGYMVPGAAFADQPNRGEARHRASLRDANIDRADDTYTDLDGKEQDTDKDTVSISFTSDMDSDFDLYKRAATYSKNEHDHYPRSFMLDLGNYSSFYPYDLVFGQAAPGLRVMGAAGYDIVGMGTSELEQGNANIQSMLKKAVSSKETLPYLTIANVSGTKSLEKAYKKYGVNDYQDLNKYRTDIAVFCVVGEEAFNSTSHSNLNYKDAVKTSKKIVKEIKEDEDADIVI